MTNGLQSLAALAALVVLLTAVVVGRYIGVASRLHVLDRPDGVRKLHAAPVAQSGGLAVALVFNLALAALVWLLPMAYADIGMVGVLVAGGALAALLGLVDDIHKIRPVAKLVGQLGIGLFFWWQGVGIDRLTGVGGEAVEVGALPGAVATAFWFALLMNGINMIDGLDGLAAGVAGISALTLSALAFSLGQPAAAAVALILAAGCAGFLVWNCPPARVFMGDTGSHFIGCQLAAIALLSSTKTPAALTLALPLIAVAIPVFETLMAFVRRLVTGRHPFRGDRGHLHHRLLAIGFSPRRTLATFCYLTGACGIVAFVSIDLPPHKTLLLCAGVLGGLGILVWNLSALEERARQQYIDGQPGQSSNSGGGGASR